MTSGTDTTPNLMNHPNIHEHSNPTNYPLNPRKGVNPQGKDGRDGMDGLLRSSRKKPPRSLARRFSKQTPPEEHMARQTFPTFGETVNMGASWSDISRAGTMGEQARVTVRVHWEAERVG
ncbi:hypothetical protein AVEN_1185-1 [Araneus ventricosus]|uniref:Uncharacterized protein n=1 Tax=Araneus ventricosus TaxID=182803 RepID=A0A4Y2EBN3_ARAVE|nr:hypothetical protein AVEN_1185-1 [Araneus ventricosus]